MSMTRKDFQALADQLRAVRPYRAEDRATIALWRRTVAAIGTACYAANGSFDRNRFDTACGADELEAEISELEIS